MCSAPEHAFNPVITFRTCCFSWGNTSFTPNGTRADLKWYVCSPRTATESSFFQHLFPGQWGMEEHTAGWRQALPKHLLLLPTISLGSLCSSKDSDCSSAQDIEDKLCFLRHYMAVAVNTARDDCKDIPQSGLQGSGQFPIFPSGSEAELCPPKSIYSSSGHCITLFEAYEVDKWSTDIISKEWLARSCSKQMFCQHLLNFWSSQSSKQGYHIAMNSQDLWMGSIFHPLHGMDPGAGWFISGGWPEHATAAHLLGFYGISCIVLTTETPMCFHLWLTSLTSYLNPQSKDTAFVLFLLCQMFKWQGT